MEKTLLINTRPSTEAATLLAKSTQSGVSVVASESSGTSYTLLTESGRVSLSVSDFLRALFEARTVHVL